jgi:hypothetical protein
MDLRGRENFRLGHEQAREQANEDQNMAIHR